MIRDQIRNALRFAFDFQIGYQRAAGHRDAATYAIREIAILPSWADAAARDLDAIRTAQEAPGGLGAGARLAVSREELEALYGALAQAESEIPGHVSRDHAEAA